MRYTTISQTLFKQMIAAFRRLAFLQALILPLVCLFASCSEQRKPGPVRVSLLGDSITEGNVLRDKERNFPARLQKLLGSEFEVMAFGKTGRTVLKKGNLPFVEDDAFARALVSEPDLVFLKLGTNDAKDINWKYKDDFRKDFEKIVRRLKKMKGKPTVHVCLPTEVMYDSFSIKRDRILQTHEWVKEVAEKHRIKVVDTFTPLEGQESMFRADGVHPNERGAAAIAGALYESNKGNPITLDEVIDRTGNLPVSARPKSEGIRRIAIVGGSDLTTKPDLPGLPVYSHELSEILGANYEAIHYVVQSTGFTSCSRRFQMSYKHHDLMSDSPDVVVIHLGLMDLERWVSDAFFLNEATRCVNCYCELPTKPTILLATPIKSDDERVAKVLIPALEKVAKFNGIALINLLNKDFDSVAPIVAEAIGKNVPVPPAAVLAAPTP